MHDVAELGRLDARIVRVQQQIAAMEQSRPPQRTSRFPVQLAEAYCQLAGLVGKVKKLNAIEADARANASKQERDRLIATARAFEATAARHAFERMQLAVRRVGLEVRLVELQAKAARATPPPRTGPIVPRTVSVPPAALVRRAPPGPILSPPAAASKPAPVLVTAPAPPPPPAEPSPSTGGYDMGSILGGLATLALGVAGLAFAKSLFDDDDDGDEFDIEFDDE